MARLGRSDRLLVLIKPFEAIEAALMAHALTLAWARRTALVARVAELEARLLRARTG